MSSALGGRDDLTSPLGGPQNKPEDLPFPDTPSKIGQQGEQKLDTPHYHKIDQRAPRSIPDVDLQQQQQKQKNLGQEAEEDQPASVSVSNEEGDEGELVPAAGRINEKGEVIDDDGNAIGKVTSGNARDFVDFVVTQEGDILDRAGGVVGKAEPLEDVASELHYYTTANNPARDNAKDDNDQTAAGEAGDEAKQAKGGGLGGAFGGVGKALGGLTGGLGRTAKGATGTVGGATKGVTDAAGEATGAEGVTGAVGDTAEGVTGAAGDTVEGAAGTADEVTAGGAEGAGGAVGDATDKVGETAEGAVDGAQDTAEGVVDKAGSAVEGVPGELGSKADDLAEGADGELGSKVDELAEQEPIPIEIPEFAPSVAAKVVAMFEGPFTVADDGQVTDQNGKILGKLAEGQDIQDLIGKEIKGIDEEGNLLGDENTVLGKVNLAPEGTIVERIKEQVPEAVERLDAIEEVKSKLPDISILEGLNINKAGNVVDEKGNVMGRIKSGDIKKLVGKQPDAEGRIWDTRGNVIGEVEVVPEAIENLVAPFEDFPDAFVDKEGKVIFEGRQIGIVSEGDVANLVGKKVDVDGDIMDKNGNVIGKALRKDPDEEPEPEVEQIDYSSLQDKKINKMGNVVDDNGQIWGRVVQGVLKNLVGKRVSENGEIFNDAGKIIGKVEPLAEEERQEVREPAPFEDFPDAVVADEGKVMFNGEQIGIVVEGDAKKLKGKTVDADGDIVDRNGNVLGHADRWEPDEPEVEQIDYSSLRDKKINKMGNVVDDKGQIWGRVIQGVLKNLVGKRVGENGEIFNDAGKLIGKVEPLAEEERQEIREPAPFEDFPDAVVADEGKVMFNGQQIGIVVEGDAKKLKGKTVDADGDIVDRNGNVLGHAERWEPEVEQIDYSSLRDKKINKMGNVVDDRGQIWGRVVQGVLTNLIGKRVGENGEIFNDAGKVIGKAEPLTDGERQDVKEPAPFEDFPNAVIADEGKVMFNGEQIGIVVEGDAKKLKGKTVDADGDIVDRNGNVLGRAERWESEAPEPEPEIDNSALAGKRINKAGNAVDSHGDIYGRVVEGDLSRLIGKMCDKNGFIRNEGGDVIGKAELLPEAEREGLKEGPFAELPGCTVNKEGHVVTPSGDIVGRLVSGDPKILFGRAVDDDGDILDRNGNVLGHAERWEPEEQPKDVNPMSGRKVNRDGNVVDENGDLIGKLTSGDLYKCAGKKIDDDGDVVDQKGSIVGHVTLLEDIPPEPEAEPEEQESEEDRLKREQLEQDRKIAKQICICIEHSLDKIRPICKMITENIDRAERTPEDERDEEELVRVVRPLIEEGGKILTEANGVIRGLDPDGRISANAKHKTAAREATPEEYHLADLLKELTGTVTETIENAKRKLEDMKYAKKELNPLWGLLAEPLFQIIAAVGLLLTGVLGLVGKLLNGLGLGGLVNNLLGGLGLTKVLDGLGLGSIVGAVTGQDDKKKKKSGGGGKFLGIL